MTRVRIPDASPIASAITMVEILKLYEGITQGKIGDNVNNQSTVACSPPVVAPSICPTIGCCRIHVATAVRQIQY
jgi:hypothetical protein